MLVGIQNLRFIAALLVVLTHAVDAIPRQNENEATSYLILGQCGVDLFFCISGFIMMLISSSKERNVLDFIAKRFTRVAPPYWIVTSLFLIILLVRPDVFHSSVINPAHIVTSFAFMAWPHPVKGDALPLYLPGWTLNAECFFYLLFALCMRFSHRRRGLICGCVIAVIVLLGKLIVTDSEILLFYTRPIMLEFALGMVVYSGYRRIPEISSLYAVSLFGLSTIYLVIGQHFFPVWRLSEHRFIAWGIPCAICLFGVVSLEKHFRTADLMKKLGDASYSIYLTHFFIVIAGSRLLLKPSEGKLTEFIIMALIVLMSIIVGVLFHLYIEKPSIRLAQRIINVRNIRMKQMYPASES